MNGIFSTRSTANVLGAVAIAVVVSGCDSDAASTGAPMTSVVESIPHDWYSGGQPILRSQADVVGGRLWVLTPEGVELYEAATHRKLAQIALPDWMWVDEQYACPPDLAIGPHGEAVISSNIVPTLWRIDAMTLKASKHELVLDEDQGKDVGFSGLVYSAQHREFFAVSALDGSMWRIDPLLRRAQAIPLSAPLPNACGLAMRPRESDRRASRLAAFCVRGDGGDWNVSLAPDQRSGYVRPGQCMI